MTRDEAIKEIENRVYEATGILEQLENQGRLKGDAHLARQKLAIAAGNDLAWRWIELPGENGK